MNKLLLLLPVLLLNACAVFNPYSSEFTCPNSYAGKCVSVQDAYTESVEGTNPVQADGKKKEEGAASVDSIKQQPETVEVRNYNAYRSELYRKFDNLLKEPNTPMVAPPKVLRVLLLPYKGQDNELYAMRHVYIFADEPRWILGDSIQALEEAAE